MTHFWAFLTSPTKIRPKFGRHVCTEGRNKLPKKVFTLFLYPSLLYCIFPNRFSNKSFSPFLYKQAHFLAKYTHVNKLVKMRQYIRCKCVRFESFNQTDLTWLYTTVGPEKEGENFSERSALVFSPSSLLFLCRWF